MAEERKYQFSWDLLGDVEFGRPNLGSKTDVAIYRLMQFTLRDIMEKEFGIEKADEIFYKAGYISGKEFYKNLIDSPENVQDFVRQLQKRFAEMGIGILRVEKLDMEKGEWLLTVSEDLECSGLPESDEEICVYDEGFISGLLESYLDMKFDVKEIDCWCTGDRTCRFHAKKQEAI